VTAGARLATIGDAKLALQIAALDAQIAGLNSQAAQAQNDVARAETLFRQGAGTRLAYDQGRTALEVAQSAIKARMAERDVLRQSLVEGAVLAPVAGRILDVPLTEGSVVLSGDVVATVAEGRFILRLRIPERHAGTIKAGDKVELDAARSGKVTLVYPRIEEGRVVADAEVEGLGDYFVGARLLVWIDAGTRRGFVVPPAFLVSRFGLDHVRLRRGEGVFEVPVQRGQVSADGVEILSGVAEGDVLVTP
jgi:multidrug efflux pump subunit AcrA (membrane-fusion protein)